MGIFGAGVANYDQIGREMDEGEHDLTISRVNVTKRGNVTLYRIELTSQGRAPFSKFVGMYPEEQADVGDHPAASWDPEWYKTCRMLNIADAKRLCYAFTGEGDVDDIHTLEGKTARLYVFRRAARDNEDEGRLDVRVPWIPSGSRG